MLSLDAGVTSSSLLSRAKELLATPSHRETATFVAHLFQHQDIQEKEAAKFLYRFCYVNFPNCLTLMLLKVFRCSIYSPEVRSHSISLLYSLLTHFNDIRFSLSPIALRDIKPVLISCLLLQETPETDFKILTAVLSRIALDVFMSDNNGWPELSECIVSVADYDLKKAIYIFRDLPAALDDDFLMSLLEKLFPEILTRLNPQHCGIKDWTSALETGFNMAVQLVDSPRGDLAGNVLHWILKSASELVREGMEETVREGLGDLATMLREEAERYYAPEYEFVSDFLNKMERMTGIGEETKKAVQKVRQILQERCFESS